MLWFKFFLVLKIFKLASLFYFIFLFLRFIIIICDKQKQKSNWFENFQTKEKFEPQHVQFAQRVVEMKLTANHYHNYGNHQNILYPGPRL